MFKARIADFNILFEEYYNLLYLRIGDFSADFYSPDITVTTTLEQIEEEERASNVERRPYIYEEQRSFRNLANQLPLYDSCVLHSCFFNVHNKGIAFAAKSGTGKTTHMRLWQELLGDDLKVINGDKPILRFFDGVPYGYGTPWMGKEGIGCNERAELTDICIIERSEVNSTVPISKEEGFLILMQQVYMPTARAALDSTVSLIKMLCDRCNFWKISCNMEPDAASIAYKTIFNLDKEV